MKFDLHNHTPYSDGLLTIEQLVKLAKNNGVKCFAVTDHDTVLGCEEAFKVGKENGIFVLKGMEFTSYYKEQMVHIVTLFKNNEVPQDIYKYLFNLKQKRINRAKEMMKRIEDIYHVDVDYDYLFSGETITRGNMYQALIRANKDLDPEKLSFMVSTKSLAYIPATKTSTLDALKFLKQFETITIFAHPTLVNPLDVEEIARLGFDGMEVRYPLNKEGEEEKFTKICDRLLLLKSAGSDFHGDNKHGIIGDCTLNEIEMAPIFAKLNINIKDIIDEK